MQGGVVGGICLLTFLLSVGRAEELAGVKDSEDLKNIEGVKEVKQSEDLKLSNESESSDDLKSELSLAVTDTNSQENDGRSGAIAHSSAHSYGGISSSNAVAQSHGGGSSSAYSDSYAGSSKSKATASVGYLPQASPTSPFNPDLGPYLPPSASSSQADAQAFNDVGSSYGQGLNSYPYTSSYPYNAGSSSAQAHAEADSGYYQPAPIATPILNTKAQALANNDLYRPISEPGQIPYKQGPFAQGLAQADNEYYQPAPIATPILNPYSQGPNGAKAQSPVDSDLYPPGSELNFQPFRQGSYISPAENGFYQPENSPTPIFNPYGQGTSYPQAQGQADSGLYQTGAIPPSYLGPYNPGSSPAQAKAQVDSESYQPIIDPTLVASIAIPRYNLKPDLPLSVPSPYTYNTGSNIAKAQAQADRESYLPTYYNPKMRPYDPVTNSKNVYQPIPIPNPNPLPYETLMVPYVEPSSAKAQAESIAIPDSKSFVISGIHNQGSSSAYQVGNEAYQPVPFPSVPSQYDRFLIPYQGPSSAQRKTEHKAYQPIPIPDPNTFESVPYLPGEDSPSGSSSYSYSPKLNSASTIAQAKSEANKPVSSREQEYESYKIQSSRARAETESDSYQSNPIINNSKYSSSYNPVRSGSNTPSDDVDYNPIDSKMGWNLYSYNQYPPSSPNPQLYPSGADGGSVAVNPYSLGLNQYAKDYPAESPYRPAGFSQPEAQTLSNAFTSVQSSPIAFEDAKSRLISPDEYVFLNKMPGADNSIQCSKENEFHHYWSQTLDCLVCICLNEYGLLTPVCASCAGCHKPPPKLPDSYPRLPEPISVLPATPPSELPGPSQLMPVEPLPSPEPIPEPFEPNPVPNPPEPSPVPITEPIPEPIPTLPPMLPGGSCSPLPSGQPFTNPLHPCQICVCQESYLTGKPDVQIQCKENPQCIAPADVTTLPPIPDLPVPIPLPLCEKFPEHVLFPHPTDNCKLCKCAKHLSDNGEQEQHITCYPHPDCVPKLEPITEPTSYAAPPLPVPIEPFLQNPFPPEPVPIPVEPLREPSQPLGPVPLPELVTVEPLPWPPVSTTALVPTSVPTPQLTPRPGPLPGPSPHESCRPYPPNQAFQHPWDECQICMCSEATAVGMITVEVNCYTKPSCCIEPPESVKPAIAGFSKPYPASNNPINDNLIVPIGSQASVLSTSTYRPAPAYPPYSPRPANIYPGSSQPTAPDVLPAGFSPGTYTRIKPEENYANQASYPYQPNYLPGYINPQYPDYPGRLPSPNGAYNQNNYGYPASYKYSQGDAIGNAYPPAQGHYQPYDPRYQGLPSPNAYPPMYHRPNYDIPPYPPGISRDGYSISQASAQGGPNALSSAQAQTGELLRSKTDVPDDLDESK